MAELIRQYRAQYAVNRNKLIQFFLAGLIATVAMSVVGFLGGVLGPMPFDYARLFGGVFAIDGPIAYSGAWWAGLAFHLFAGSVLYPLVYDYLVDKAVLPNRPQVKGLALGVALWLFLQAVVMPMAGFGFFARLMAAPFWMSFVNLIGCLVYGYTLESMSRVRMVHTIEEKTSLAA